MQSSKAATLPHLKGGDGNERQNENPSKQRRVHQGNEHGQKECCA